MKISNNALNFLLAQYRAIFKRAYVKGIASAVILTAALATGQAQAKAPTLDEGQTHYFKGSTSWTQQSSTFHKKDGITAGAIGGNYFSGDGLEDEFKLTNVSGGELTIGGKNTDPGYLEYVQSGTVAGGWAVASTGNITAQDNVVTVVGSGSVTKDGALAGSRGAIFGAYAVADKGTASALSNKIFVKDRNTDGLATAAASNGFIGGRAVGVGSAVADSNEIHVLGTDTTKRQVLGLDSEYDVLGGHATTKDGTASTKGTYEASQNIVELQHVSANGVGASKKGLTIAGAYVSTSGTGTFTVNAAGNQVDITDLYIATDTSASSDAINIFGAFAKDKDNGIVSGTVTMSDNTVTMADSNIQKNANYTGPVRVIGAAALGNKSAKVSLTGNKVTLSDSVNTVDKTDNTVYAEILAGAQLDSLRDDGTKLQATVTGNSRFVSS